jgi:hypothetical protein
MTKLAILTLSLISNYAVADDSAYYRPLPAGKTVKITLKSIVLPAHADAVTFLGLGSDNFEFRLSFNNKKKGVLVTMAQNTLDVPKTYDIGAELNLPSDTVLNPYVNRHRYSDHRHDWWFRMVSKGRVCLIRTGSMIADRFGCFDPVIIANKMIDHRESSFDFDVQDSIDDSRGEGNRPFATPMISSFHAELE